MTWRTILTVNNTVGDLASAVVERDNVTNFHNGKLE